MNSKEPEKKLCSECKNFYGTEATNWMCSVCYKKSHPKASNPIQPPKQPEKGPAGPAQENKDRCMKCHKKLGLMGIQCKCGYIFCNTHRVPEEHNCTYNYQKAGRQKIGKDNQKVVHRKLSDI